MKTRPFYYSIYASLLMVSAAILFLMDVYRRQNSLGSWVAAMNDTDLQILWACFILTLAALMAIRVSLFFKYYLPAFVTVLLFAAPSILTLFFSIDDHHLQIAGALFVVSHTPFLIGKNRKVFLNSHLRWWLVPKRKPLSRPVHIKTVRGDKIIANSFDVSDEGIFLALEDAYFLKESPQILKGLLQGSRATLKIMVTRFREVECQAQIVRTQMNESGKYPCGLALRFIGLPSKDRWYISEAIRT